VAPGAPHSLLVVAIAPPPLRPQVFYNNLLSLPLIFVLMTGSGELYTMWYEPDLWNPAFLCVAALSGLIGFGIRWARGRGK
jgi:hypothetical protein